MIDEHLQHRNRFQNIDPFEILSEIQFITTFRLSKDLCRFLVDTLTPFIRPKRRATDLSVTTRVLVALRFFATRSYQLDIGRGVFVSVSQPSVSRCIEEVTLALNEPEIFNTWVKFPRNFEELNRFRRNFYEDFNFPGVAGYLDCTHVAIFPPKIDDELNPEDIYVNRKGYHSINVQLTHFPGSTGAKIRQEKFKIHWLFAHQRNTVCTKCVPQLPSAFGFNLGMVQFGIWSSRLLCNLVTDDMAIREQIVLSD